MSNIKIKQWLLMNLQLSIWVLAWALLAGCDRATVAQSPAPIDPVLTQADFVNKTVIGYQGASKHRFINNHTLYSEGWDTLAQAKFWQQVIALSHDSMIINVASARQPLFKMASCDWHCQTELEKDAYKQNVIASKNLDATTSLYVTSGKKFFFEYKKVLPLISRSLPVFEKNNTDPWYADR